MKYNGKDMSKLKTLSPNVHVTTVKPVFETTCINPFPNDKFWTLPNTKILQMTISKLMKMAESSSNGEKTLWEKEKLLIMCNFSFSHSVFKRLVPQTLKNQGLFGKGLRDHML